MGKNKYVKIKQKASKNPVGQWRNQRGNEKNLNGHYLQMMWQCMYKTLQISTPKLLQLINKLRKFAG